MSMLYATFNFSRGVLSFADFFLFFLSGFAVVVIRLSLPFMIAAMFHKEYAQKITIGYFWTTFVWLLIFPGMCQFIRLLAFAGGSVAMGLGGDNAYYSWDSTTGKIISNGNPEAVIIIGSLYMLFASLCLFAAFFLSLYFSKGKTLEGIISTTSAWWTAATSIGIGLGTGAVSQRFATQAERTTAKAAHEAQLTEAEFTKEASINSANKSNEASKVLADSSQKGDVTQAEYNKQADDLRVESAFEREKVGAFAGLVDRIGNIRADQYQSKAQALMNLRADWANLNSKEKQERMTNALDFMVKNNDAYAREIQQAIKDYPEAKELLGKQLDNYLNGVPIVGSVLKTIGLNGDAVNAWLGSQAGRDFLSKTTITNGQADLIKGIDTTEGLFSDRTISKALQQDVQNAQNYGNMNLSQGNIPTPKSRNMTRLQKRNYRNLQRVMRQDPEFLRTVQNESAKRGINPDHILNMLAIESSFNKNARNKFGYLGLGQVGRKERRGLRGWTGNDAIDMARIRRMSASQQLRTLVFPFVDDKFGKNTRGITMDKLYAGWGSGHYRNNPNYIHMSKNGKRARAYKNNPQWDYNDDGVVQQWEFGPVAYKNLGAGQFFTAGEIFGKLRSVDIPTAKVKSAQFARQYQRRHELNQNKLNYQGKENIASNYYNEQRSIAQNKYNESVGIADNVASAKTNLANTNYGYNIQQANITRNSGIRENKLRFQGVTQRAQILKDGSYKAADINRDAAIKSANLAYLGRERASAINYQAALEASHTRALSQMFQTIGSNTGHHIAEASEKFNRL